jgi:uncharacterized membrane protein
MVNTKSPVGKLNKQELLRTLRDTALIGVVTIVLTLVEVIPQGDYGEWQFLIIELSAFATILLNRYLNILRV